MAPTVTTSSGRRAVLDASFWMSELSNRVSLIRAETEKLLQDIERCGNDVTNKDMYTDKYNLITYQMES